MTTPDSSATTVVRSADQHAVGLAPTEDVLTRVLAILGQEPHDGEVVEATSAFTHSGTPWRAMLPVPLPTRVHCPWGITPADALADDHKARRADAQDHLIMLRREAAHIHTKVTWWAAECADKHLEEAVLEPARMAGLIVAGVPPEDTGETPVSARWFVRLLTESGRPVLVIPRRASLAHPPRQALVAWRDTPESARALHEALRWLPMACTLRIVMAVGAGETHTAGATAENASLLLAHVQRHGRSATFEIIDRQGRPPEDALLDEVARTNPDLVVMGAYGHTHSMEFVFGGVTVNMLHRSRVPLLMAH